MKNLNPIQLPLNKSVLIEASAGTGKTFTIANLYLRLLLGIGCNPLTVEQILVVTFTKAATEELKNRIRKNIQQCADFLKIKLMVWKWKVQNPIETTLIFWHRFIRSFRIFTKHCYV